MITTTTIRLNNDIKAAASKAAKDNNIRGGLSGLIEFVLIEYLKNKKTTSSNK